MIGGPALKSTLIVMALSAASSGWSRDAILFEAQGDSLHPPLSRVDGGQVNFPKVIVTAFNDFEKINVDVIVDSQQPKFIATNEFVGAGAQLKFSIDAGLGINGLSGEDATLECTSLVGSVQGWKPAMKIQGSASHWSYDSQLASCTIRPPAALAVGNPAARNRFLRSVMDRIFQIVRVDLQVKLTGKLMKEQLIEKDIGVHVLVQGQVVRDAVIENGRRLGLVLDQMPVGFVLTDMVNSVGRDFCGVYQTFRPALGTSTYASNDHGVWQKKRGKWIHQVLGDQLMTQCDTLAGLRRAGDFDLAGKLYRCLRISIFDQLSSELVSNRSDGVMAQAQIPATVGNIEVDCEETTTSKELRPFRSDKTWSYTPMIVENQSS